MLVGVPWDGVFLWSGRWALCEGAAGGGLVCRGGDWVCWWRVLYECVCLMIGV